MDNIQTLMSPQRVFMPNHITAFRKALPGSAVRGCVGAVLAALSLVAAAADVGGITFVIGKVRIVNVAGEVRNAEAGGRVAPGDHIETPAGGHVHLRFIDGGFVSVRPGSSFTLEAYDTDKSNTAIRFKLDQGVMRSISGAATQANKERFRLNTPLAAIGVRGTDFVVQSDASGVRAVVNQGAIVVAPFDGACVAQALGPCATTSARELSDTMGRVLLEMSGMQPARIVPFNGKSPDSSAPPAPQEPSQRQALTVALETAGEKTARSQSGLDVAGANPGTTTPVPPVSVSPPSAPVPEPALPTLLQWGRWSDLARAGDIMSVSAQEARQGRSVTIGNDYVNLYRTTDNTNPLPSSLGEVAFSLRAGQVALVQSSGASSAGTVDGGWLKIDFTQRSFSTLLNVSHGQTGAVQVQSAGAVSSNGIFSVSQGGSRVAGAVTMDASQAGYLFDKVVPQGTLSGATLWKR